MAQRVKTFNARPDDLSWISEGHRSSKVWTPASSPLTPRHVFHVCVCTCAGQQDLGRLLSLFPSIECKMCTTVLRLLNICCDSNSGLACTISILLTDLSAQPPTLNLLFPSLVLIIM